MPVSSPSYFPPNRANGTVVGINAGTTTTGSRNFLAGLAAGRYTDISDLICIGDSAFSAGTSSGHITDTNLAGSIFIGSSAGAALFQTTGGGTEGNTFIGYQCGAATTQCGSTVLLGWKLMPTANPGGGGVNRNLTAMGSNSILGNYGTLHESVVIGSDISVGPSGGNFSALTSSVIIGYQACNAGPNAGGYNNSVVIGYQAALSGVQVTNCAIVGGGAAGTSTFMANMALFGSGINASGGPQQTTAIGCGVNASLSNAVLIGYNCNSDGSVPGSTAPFCFAVNYNNSTPHRLLFGDFASGNLALGSSQNAQDLNGTNLVKLMSGSVSGNPVGGGYFYVAGAANSDMPLHWINAAGADTALGPSGSKLEGTGNGVLTPAALAAGNTDAWEPAGVGNGLGQAQYVRMSGNAGGSTLQGLSPGSSGQVITLVNVGANTITIAHNASGTSAANILLPGAANLNLSQFSSLKLWHDATLNKWISVARSN